MRPVQTEEKIHLSGDRRTACRGSTLILIYYIIILAQYNVHNIICTQYYYTCNIYIYILYVYAYAIRDAVHNGRSWDRLIRFFCG